MVMLNMVMLTFFSLSYFDICKILLEWCKEGILWFKIFRDNDNERIIVTMP
jgi:hypothetical protein